MSWKSRLRAAAPGPAAAWVRLKEWSRSTRGGGRYLEGIFAEIYHGALWGEPESVSGPGSSLAATAAVRRELPGLLAGLGVRSLLDAPCGDCHWILGAPLGLDHYIGADIVPALVERNAAALGAPGREFRCLDITRDPLPPADAILCRDCLIHFSYRFIARALANFRRSGARYLLTTTYSGLPANHDILSGQWRPLDLELPPFSLPPPVGRIVEKEYEEGGLRLRRSLGVWNLAEMR
jgi:SAM-dependent methyltransferase